MDRARVIGAGKTGLSRRPVHCGIFVELESAEWLLRRRELHNAHRCYERYVALAREATLSDAVVEAENCYQHAEHYFRVMQER